MNKNKLLALLFLLVSNLGTWVVASNYTYLLNCDACSAPAYIAFIYAIPFACILLILLFIMVKNNRKNKRKNIDNLTFMEKYGMNNRA